MSPCGDMYTRHMAHVSTHVGMCELVCVLVCACACVCMIIVRGLSFIFRT